MDKFYVLAIMGKSGTGKSSVIHKLCQDHHHDLYYVKSFTTRKPRENDVNDIESHYFVGEDFYKAMARDGKIVALYESPSGYHSFTTQDCFHKDKINLYAIDPVAFKELKVLIPEMRGVYLDISEDERKKRFEKREGSLDKFKNEDHLSKDVLGEDFANIIDVSDLSIDETIKKFEELVLSWEN